MRKNNKYENLILNFLASSPVSSEYFMRGWEQCDVISWIDIFIALENEFNISFSHDEIAYYYEPKNLSAEKIAEIVLNKMSKNIFEEN